MYQPLKHYLLRGSTHFISVFINVELAKQRGIYDVYFIAVFVPHFARKFEILL